MADGVEITPGTGTVVATDDISGVHYQRVKPTLGPDGSAVDARAIGDIGGLAPAGVLAVGQVPHAVGYSLVGDTAQYTSAQTGAAHWTPASGKRLVITSYVIQAAGTTPGTVQLWFGASGDTSYTRGTDYAIFDGEFAPSDTSKPGVVQTGLWVASAADHILRVTTSAAITVTVTVWGYEV